MNELIQELAPQVGIPAAIIFAILRVYRLDFTQNMLPAVARWSSLSPLMKFLLPFSVASLGGLVAILMGTAAPTALSLATAAALSAISGHHATKLLGEAVDKRSVLQDPGYQPSPFRKAGSIVVPMSKLLANEEPEEDQRP